jgi:hypothetical protein
MLLLCVVALDNEWATAGELRLDPSHFDRPEFWDTYDLVTIFIRSLSVVVRRS